MNKDKNKLMVGLVLLAGTIGLGVWQGLSMVDYQARLDSATDLAAELTIESKKLTEGYQDIKADVVESRESAQQALSLVFPAEEEITDFTRLMDNFSVKNNFSSNPFFVSNLSYQNAKVSEDENYRYVPVSMSVKTSKKNLSKFLEYVEDSGSLESEVRLMSIEEMDVGYPDEYGETYDVKFLIHVYFAEEI